MPKDSIEQLLKNSEENYRALVETSQDLIWQCDIHGRYIFLNQAWEEVFGYKTSEMLGKAFTDFQTPDIAKRDMLEFSHLMKRGILKDYRTIHLGKNGKKIHLSFNAKYVHDENGNVIGTRGTARDISEIEEMGQRYQNIFESMIDGMALHEIICDENNRPINYRFLDINPAFERLTGLKRNILGKTVLDILPGTEPYWIETYGKVALTGETISFENVSKELGKYFQVTAYQLQPKQFACIFVDITERKKSEEIIRNSQRIESLGVLASGIAHDFNNLLGGVFGNIELAQHSLDNKDKANNYLNKALAAVDRSRDLTKQLITFSKGSQPNKSVVHVKKVIDESISLSLSGSAIQCNHNVASNLDFIEADINQLSQVFNNILLNARQAISDTGAIEITSENTVIDHNKIPNLQPGKYVKIIVQDNGDGIPEHILPKIFDPFFTTKSTGSGLGLAMCYSIVRKHSGMISIESEPNRGTAVTIYLPAK